MHRIGLNCRSIITNQMLMKTRNKEMKKLSIRIHVETVECSWELESVSLPNIVPSFMIWFRLCFQKKKIYIWFSISLCTKCVHSIKIQLEKKSNNLKILVRLQHDSVIYDWPELFCVSVLGWRISSIHSRQPEDRDVRQLGDERVRSSWRPHWNHESCPMCSQRYVLCHLVRPMSMILSLGHRAVIPRLVCRLRCANLWLHNRICNWLEPISRIYNQLTSFK